MDEEKRLSGKEVANKIKEDLKIEVEEIRKKGIVPKLAVMMINQLMEFYCKLQYQIILIKIKLLEELMN